LAAHVLKTHGADPGGLRCELCGSTHATTVTLEEHLRSAHGVLPWTRDEAGKKQLKCAVCEHSVLPAEMETHLRFSHGVMPVRHNQKSRTLTLLSTELSAEAILRTLTPDTNSLLRCLTPLPVDALDSRIDFML